MKKFIQTVNTIEAPVDAVWAQIRTGENVDTWLPIITSCRVEGNKRYCTTEDGALDETILKSDDQEKVFQYAIGEQNLFPVTGIKGTMRLREVDEQTTNLFWDLEFDLQDENLFGDIKEGIEGLYTAGALGLGQLANQAA